MSKIFQLLGENFKNKDGASLEMSSIRGQGKVIGVYFSAHWCPPCRVFTPKLAKFYKNVKESNNGDRFEMLFVSSDKNETQFSEYLCQMPWYALPFERRSEKAKLSKYFKVSGIPTLILLDGETGKVINKNGRDAVDKDPEGKNFPWKTKTLQDMLRKGEYINNKGEKKSFEEDIEGKVLGIYFSAHWCPPCKMFTPTLCGTYKKLNEGEEKPFEIIFVSSDQNEETFKQYFSEMPFLALPYDSEVKDELSEYFEVEGIPTLIILDRDGNVITSSGRAVVSGDKEGEKFPWYPEPVEKLDQLSGAKVNEEACLIYIPAGDKEAFEKMKEILMPIGKECQEQAKKEDRPQELYFLLAPTEKSEIVESLCEFIGMKHDEKALFIADVRSGEIYKSESVEPVKDEVKKFVNDFLDGKLVAKAIRDSD